MPPIHPETPLKYVPPNMVIIPIIAPGEAQHDKDIEITVSTHNDKLVDQDDAVRISVSCSYDKGGFTHHKALGFFLFVFGGVNQATFHQRIEADWLNFTVYADGVSYDKGVQIESSSRLAQVS